jgi:hypothetical protein
MLHATAGARLVKIRRIAKKRVDLMESGQLPINARVISA